MTRHTRMPAPLGSDPAASLRRAVRWLELRSFSLAPENFSQAEGLRAALAVCLPLLLVLASGRRDYGWAVCQA